MKKILSAVTVAILASNGAAVFAKDAKPATKKVSRVHKEKAAAAKKEATTTAPAATPTETNSQGQK